MRRLSINDSGWPSRKRKENVWILGGAVCLHNAYRFLCGVTYNTFGTTRVKGDIRLTAKHYVGKVRF